VAGNEKTSGEKLAEQIFQVVLERFTCNLSTVEQCLPEEIIEVM